MTNVIQTQTMPKSNHQQTELSTQDRALLAEGRTVEEIMALTGTKKHIVGLIKYHMERQSGQRISPITGKPVRRYIKRKKAKAKTKPAAKPKTSLADERTMLLWDRKRLKDELADAAESMLQMRQEIRDLRERPPIQIEVPVLQPISHLTFWQRLRILFLGGAA